MENEIYKAYNNKDFLNGKVARPIRVLCELIEPEERLKENNIENTIVFFGSARPRPQEVADRELGDFESKLVSGKTVAVEESDQHCRLKRIQKLSKYYGGSS